MKTKSRISTVLAEKDAKVAAAATAVLDTRSYEIAAVTSRQALIDRLKAFRVGIALVGDVEGAQSPFATLRELVLSSPMTSIILITDASADEVEKRAEGYGILGHIGRDIPAADLEALLDSFEKIQRELGN